MLVFPIVCPVAAAASSLRLCSCSSKPFAARNPEHPLQKAEVVTKLSSKSPEPLPSTADHAQHWVWVLLATAIGLNLELNRMLGTVSRTQVTLAGANLF